MSDDWHFTHNRERQGPVSFERLQKLAREGWLLPTDLVWHAGLTEWIAAGQVQGLFGNPVGLCIEVGQLFGQAVANLGKAWREAGERRLRAQELALEKQRLDLEAARATFRTLAV